MRDHHSFLTGHSSSASESSGVLVWIPKRTGNVNPAAERARRVEQYAKMLGLAPKPSREGYWARPVRVVELNLTFPTVSEAAKGLGTNAANIRNALRTKGASGNLHFTYAGEPLRFRAKCEVPVICSDGRVFENASAAYRAIGAAKSSFFDALNRGLPIKGLTFRRAGEDAQ